MLTIGSFTFRGVIYERFLDVSNPSTPVVIVQVIGGPALTTITEAQRGEIDGKLFPQPYGQQCYTDQADPFKTEYFYKFFSQPNTPFASVLVAVEGCPSIVCDLVAGPLVVTDESGIGLNDGGMSAVVTTSFHPFRCTLDNLNFLPDDTCSFTNLAPGDYILYIYDKQACELQEHFTVNKYGAIHGCTDPAATNYNPSAQINDGSCLYPIPDTNAENLSNLYEAPDQFRLTIGSDIYEVREPKDWDKISIVLKRDDTYHGVNYVFSEGDIKLRFDDEAGRQLLIAAHDSGGNDAIVRFQFGYDSFGVFIPYFDGFVDFNSYEKQENYVQCGVKRKVFSDLLQTRADVQVKLQDGAIQLPLHSKLIKMSTVINEANAVGDTQVLSINDYNAEAPTGDDPFLAYYSYLDFSGAAQNDLSPNAPLFGIYTDNPITVGSYIFQTSGGGVFQFNLDFAVQINIKLEQKSICIGAGPRHGYWNYRWFLVVNNFPNAYELPGSMQGFTNSRYNTVNYQTSWQQTLTLNQGDQVYLFGLYTCEKRGCLKDAEVYMNRVFENINISGDTLALSSSASSFLAFEAVQAVLTYVTDGQIATPSQPLTAKANLKSDLLGRTDLGYDADGCAALLAYTNGYQIRQFDIANRPVYISFSDIIKGLNATYCIGLGNEVDSFGNYLLRLEKAEYFYQDVQIVLFDTVSDYNEDVDGALIYNELEFGYTKYTNNLPSSNNSLDEFCTVHSYLTPIQSFKQKLTQKCAQITSGYAIELTRRQYFANTPNDNWTYDEDNFIISTVRDGAGAYKSETTENFTASGIIGPQTAYNLRLAISRMVDRWSKFINSGLAYKLPSDVLVNTYVAYNGDLTSQLIAPDGCDSLQQFTESQSLTLGAVGSFQKLFLPTKITFKKRISFQTLSFLIRCFQGQDTNGLNNGYIAVVDPEGRTQQGFLTELQYNPESELANFTLRKKFVDLNVPFDCSVYSSDDFAQFEAATGLPTEIEQCTFSNFE